MFVGMSPLHSTLVGYVLNLQTKSISPQFHVVYDELFTSVDYVEINERPPNWEHLTETKAEFLLEDYYFENDLAEQSIDIHLANEWLDDDEIEMKNL